MHSTRIHFLSYPIYTNIYKKKQHKSPKTGAKLHIKCSRARLINRMQYCNDNKLQAKLFTFWFFCSRAQKYRYITNRSIAVIEISRWTRTKIFSYSSSALPYCIPAWEKERKIGFSDKEVVVGYCGCDVNRNCCFVFPIRNIYTYICTHTPIRLHNTDMYARMALALNIYNQQQLSSIVSY